MGRWVFCLLEAFGSWDWEEWNWRDRLYLSWHAGRPCGLVGTARWDSWKGSCLESAEMSLCGSARDVNCGVSYMGLDGTLTS